MCCYSKPNQVFPVQTDVSVLHTPPPTDTPAEAVTQKQPTRQKDARAVGDALAIMIDVDAANCYKCCMAIAQCVGECLGSCQC